MKLTVVGCSPAWPNAGSPHSGYLVEGSGSLLLDCGPGVLSKLRERGNGWPEVDAIAITHWHLDHWGDLVPWVWGMMFGLGRGRQHPEVWVPPGGIAQLADFGVYFGTRTMFEDTFPLAEYAAGEPFLTAAGLEVTATLVPHYTVEAYAFRVTDGERSVAYSGDSAPADELADVARDADLFLCEATLGEANDDGQPRGHLSADEAIAAFGASGAKRLLVTHRPLERPVPEGIELACDGLELEL
jgi:ribonuclease BN (tRNA processing enzyme)